MFYKHNPEFIKAIFANIKLSNSGLEQAKFKVMESNHVP